MANEIQKYTFGSVPTSGTWKPVYNGNASTGSMATVSNGVDLGNLLGQIAGIDSAAYVSCSGDYSSGFTVEFVSVLANTNMLTLSYQDSTLAIAGSGSIATIQEGGSGTNEQQTVTINGDGGTFTLTSYLGTTPAITRGNGTTGDTDTASNITTALNAIGHSVASSVLSPGVIRVEFLGIDAGNDVAEMTINAGALTQSVSISVSVIQEGSPVSSGSAGTMLLMGVGK